MSYGNNEMLEKAARLCRAYLPGAWKRIACSDIEVTRISGGLSNWLYHVKLRKTSSEMLWESPKEVLLRLYGQSHGECGIQHTITESVIFALLSERKLGPRLYGVFSGGRIEEYIPARPLKIHEMSDPKLSLLVAEKMAAIHSLNLPLSKEPTWLWETSTRWLNDVGDINSADIPMAKLKNLLRNDLFSELKWLRKHLCELHSPVVFCHNDMQEGNILLRSSALKQLTPSGSGNSTIMASSLIIIDYEYCAYNFRAFELANHFIEWIYDYKEEEYPYFSVCEDRYPTLQQQHVFIKRYLEKLGSDESLHAVMEEVKHFTLASHMFWCLWALVNAKVSKIKFGYWEYAAERLTMYYKLKSQLLGGAGPPNLPILGLRACAESV